MIIMQSEILNVYMFKDYNYKGDAIYTVKYGLQIEKSSNFDSAQVEFKNCCEHSAQCEGMD